MSDNQDTAEMAAPLPPNVEPIPVDWQACYNNEKKWRVGLSIATGVLAVLFVASTAFAISQNNKDSRPAPGTRPGLRGQFGQGGGFGQGNAQGGGQGSTGQGGVGQGGFAGRGLGDLKDRLFDSSGKVDTNAVKQLVDNIPSASKTQFLSRINSVIDNQVSSGNLTKTQGNDLKAAFSSAAGTSSSTSS